MRPAHRASRALVSVGLQDAAEPGAIAARMVALAVRAVAVQRCRWVWAAERTVIPVITPQPAGLGDTSAWIEHGHGRVVGMNTLCRYHVSVHGMHQRTHESRGLAKPIGQGGPVQLDTGAGADFELAMQRTATGEFATAT